MEARNVGERRDERPGRSERDREILQVRRQRAAEMFRRGEKQSDVARQLRVSRQSVSRWHAEWLSGGMRALKKAKRSGRPPKLSAAQINKVERTLLRGARANGYPTELWTLKRVGEVIKKVTGVAYSQGHVWRILQSMNWSLQRPAKKPRERDDQALEQWRKNDWPRVKKTRADAAPSSSSKTSPASR